jgi:peptide chain release factor subunit 1
MSRSNWTFEVAPDESQATSNLRLRRFLRRVGAARGQGTSLISVYVKAGGALSHTAKLLVDEYGAASCIKSRVTRHAVQEGLRQLQARLRQYRKVPANGLVLLAGEVELSDPSAGRTSGAPAIVLERRRVCVALEPPSPLQRSAYRCDSHFYLEPLHQLSAEGVAHGVVVVNGDGALLGMLQAGRRSTLYQMSTTLPNKHSRGGWSQQRYGRHRV